MKVSSLFAAAAVSSLLLAGAAVAQTAPATKSDAGASPKATKAQSAASLECSKEADAKGLHGKARKKFRAECKKNAAAGDNKMTK